MDLLFLPGEGIGIASWSPAEDRDISERDGKAGAGFRKESFAEGDSVWEFQEIRHLKPRFIVRGEPREKMEKAT